MSKIRVGVYGTGRGANVAGYFATHEDVEIVAGCDAAEAVLAAFAARFPKARLFRDYQELLAHDFDILILASYCHDHGPDAVQALTAGKHVFSEVTAFHTPAEGVALVEAVEKSRRLYMLAENYCYLRDVLEMQHLFAQGHLGQFLYGEGEYVQDNRHYMWRKADGSYHWRCWLPPSYYSSHALGPLLEITSSRPVAVSGQNVTGKTPGCPNPIDFAALIVRLDNGGVVHVLVSFSPVRQPDSIWFSVYGTRGSVEGGRLREQQMTDVFLYNPEDDRAEYATRYRPRFRPQGQGRAQPGKGEMNYFTVHHFLEALRGGTESPLDVYRACDLTLPGILAYRSAVQGGILLEVPDFRDAAARGRYRHDESACPRDEVVRHDVHVPAG